MDGSKEKEGNKLTKNESVSVIDAIKCPHCKYLMDFWDYIVGDDMSGMYVPFPVFLRADVTLNFFIGVDPVNDPELYCPV